MIQQYLGISPDKLIKAGWETLYMVGFSLIIGSIVGFFIAIVLWLTRKGGLKENPLLYTILNGFINIIRSTPFIILLVCVMPFTKIIVGTRTFNFPLMFATVFILIAFVWIIQSVGNRLSQKRRTHQ